jgi:hypothetical protein
MSERWSVESRLRPAVTYLTVWLSASVFAGLVWASAAGAQEPYRGSLPVAPSSTVTTGDAFSPSAVVFVELDARVTITVFADRSCDRVVVSNTFDLSGLETSGPPVTIDAPGQYYARSQVDDGPLSNCERLVEVVDEPALEVSQDGDTLRATSNLRGVMTAVLMEPGCTGGALGSTQWRADARTSQSPPLAAPPGRPAASVQVILSGDSGRTVTTCDGVGLEDVTSNHDHRRSDGSGGGRDCRSPGRTHLNHPARFRWPSRQSHSRFANDDHRFDDDGTVDHLHPETDGRRSAGPGRNRPIPRCHHGCRRRGAAPAGGRADPPDLKANQQGKGHIMSVITTAVHTMASIPAGEWAQDLSNPSPNMNAPGVNQWATLAGFLKGWGIVILGLVALAGAVLFGVGGRGNSGMRSTGAMMVGGSVFAAILLGVVIPIFNQFT